ncbi:MAG: MBL fold metallo-hydrolase [Actinomycetota bacterium]|nr:MBL fold metallo-hydrolase [Actinomycetota bacterium]
MRGPRELAPGVYGLGTELVNWYLVENGGRLTAIDAGLPKFATTLDGDLRGLGHSVSDVEAVVLTHSDADHTGVAPRLRDAGARVLIHADDAAALRKPGPKKGDASPRHVLGNLWRPETRTILRDTLRYGGARPSKVDDPETFSDGDVLDVPGRPRVVHAPGHTAGHSALLFERKDVLFAGDALITHQLITKGAGVRLMPRFVNEDNAACLASLTRLETVSADLVLLGHGEPWHEGPAAAAAQARAAAEEA